MTPLTICIPTKNRGPFLARLLRYFATVGCPFRILIGDSSGDDHAAMTRAAIDALQGRLDVRYEPCPGMVTAACFDHLAGLVETPCCTYVADDDFLSPSGLAACVEYLHAHPRCSGVHGVGVIVELDRSGAHGALRSVRPYAQAVIDARTGAGRLRQYFEQLAPVVYAVHRTADWQAMFDGIQELPWTQRPGVHKEIFRDELLPSALSAVRGPIVELPVLTLVRQAHDGIYRQPDAYDWLTDAIWFPSFEAFVERIGGELTRVDGMDAAQARATLRDMLEPYLAEYLQRTWRARKTQARAAAQPGAQARALARGLPGLRQLRTWLRRSRRAAVPADAAAWLDDASPHAAAFGPIYAAMTAPVEGAPSTPARTPVEAVR